MMLGGRFKSWSQRLATRLDEFIDSVQANPVPAIVALSWFAVAYATTIWIWGTNPKIFFAPDESLNRLAAGVLAKRGEPFLDLSFSDPEDLAHPRHWVTFGGHAIPSYAPVAIYGYALLIRLDGLGWITVLPALAIGAFSVGLARLLPRGRQWLALFAPFMGFPALYWLTRPWMNLSVLLICVCWAFFFWATWLREQRPVYLGIAIGWVGAAAAVRPDCAAYLMTVALLFGVAHAPEQWRRVASFVLLSGSAAVAVNLLLNWLVTGHPTLAAYQIVAARDEGPGMPSGPLNLLRQLTVPMGVPSFALITRSLAKYWLKMGPIAGLLLAVPGIVLLLRKQKPLQIALQLAAIAVMVLFMLSRMDPNLNGAAARQGSVDHSMPRYWSPIYLLATVPAVLAFGRLRQRGALLGVALVLGGLSIAGARHVWLKDRACFVKMRRFVERNEEAMVHVKTKIPPQGYVYTATHDKIIWPLWRLGSIELSETDRSAASMHRALDAGLDVYVYETHFGKAAYRRLLAALRRQDITLVRLSWQGIYRLRRYRTPSPRPDKVVAQPEHAAPVEVDDDDDGSEGEKSGSPSDDDDDDAPLSDETFTRRRKIALPLPSASAATPPR